MIEGYHKRLKLVSVVRARVRFLCPTGTLLWPMRSTLPLNGSEDAGDVKMAVSELVAAYRLHSAHCTEIAHRSRDPEIKLALLSMAQFWLKLADQAVRNSETVLVYETPMLKRS